jgi:hypothetical protein
MHAQIHSEDLKGAETRTQDPLIQHNKISHLITHLDWLNPQLSMGLRMQYGLTDLPIATPPPPPPPPGMMPGGPPPGPPGPPGAPPPGPSQSAAPAGQAIPPVHPSGPAPIMGKPSGHPS